MELWGSILEMPQASATLSFQRLRSHSGIQTSMSQRFSPLSPKQCRFLPSWLFFLGGVTLGSLWVSIIIARCYCVIYKAIHILPILVESCFYLPQLKLSLFFAANMTCFPWTHASRSDLPSTASGKACAFVDCSSP